MTTNGTPTLTQTLTPEVCAKVTATMHPAVHKKICKAFVEALGKHQLDVIAADGTSPAGEWVMAFFVAEMDRLGWTGDVRRAMRLNVRVVGMNLIRETAAITRR